MRGLVAIVVVMGCAASGTSAPPPTPKRVQETQVATTSATPVASVSASTSVSASAFATPAMSKLVVHLVPLGDLPEATLLQTVEGLHTQVPTMRVVVEKALPLDEAKTAEKGRYSADKLLRVLERVPAAPIDKVMGVAEIDIVTPKNGVTNWGILGLGSIDGKSCVISTYRMRRVFEKGGVPESLVRERLWKISLHELGHTFGLEHCPNVGCLMQDAQGTVKTVDDEHALCDTCAARYKSMLAP